MLNRLTVIIVLILGDCCAYAQVLSDSNGRNKLELKDNVLSIVATPDSLIRNTENALDSIRVHLDKSLESLRYSYDSLNTVAMLSIAYTQQKIDSLSSLNLPSAGLINKIDSIELWRNERLDTIKSNMENLKQKATQTINTIHLPAEFDGKIGEVESLLEKVDVPLLNELQPTLGAYTKLSLGVGDEGFLQGQNLVMGDMSIPSTDFKNIEGIPANFEDASSLLENKAIEISDIDETQIQADELIQLKATTHLLKDQEAMKERLIQESAKEAVDHFAGKDEELKQAMELVSKYKKKYGSFQGFEDFEKRRPNEMRGKPLIERLLPGIAIQIHQRNQWLFDFNPYIGYKFNGRLTLGAGWNQRIAYDFEDNTFYPELRIYGPRAYGEYKITEGLNARLETEYMKTTIPPAFSTGAADPEGREWVFSSMLGLKKDYRLFKKVRGTAIILYNLYDPHHRSPYAERLNMRFGFEFPMNNKRKVS